MKLVKSLLLGSAAGLVAAAGAQAADLPTRKAAPVDYVRICAVHGPGFFYIPGSDTCIRLSGRVRFEYFAGQVYAKSTDPSSFTAFGRFAIDARTTTDWGLLRAYTRVDFARGTGNDYFGSGSALRRGTAFAWTAPGGFPGFAGVNPANNVMETAVNISAAFVQFGGLTAGRIQSFYDFYADNDTWFGGDDSDVLTQALAYTYTFGSGFSATLSFEDPAERNRFVIAGSGSATSGAILHTGPNASYDAVFYGGNFANSPFGPFGGIVTGISAATREFVPDVVGVLRVDQGWGSAQLSGAYHRISTVGATILNGFPAAGGGVILGNNLLSTVHGGWGAENGNAWAVQGGVKLNLPWIAPGDTLWVQAAYSRGNLSYVSSGQTGTFTGTNYGVGGAQFSSYDAVLDPYGKLQLTPAYSGLVAFTHYWVPTLRSSIVGSFVHVNYSGAIRNAAGYAAGSACPTCAATILINGSSYNPYSPFYNGGTQYVASANLVWSPVKNLDLGVEVMYVRDQLQHSAYDVNVGAGRVIKSDDVWTGRLRVQRDF
jgi:hypothetical protein